MTVGAFLGRHFEKWVLGEKIPSGREIREAEIASHSTESLRHGYNKCNGRDTPSADDLYLYSLDFSGNVHRRSSSGHTGCSSALGSANPRYATLDEAVSLSPLDLDP